MDMNEDPVEVNKKEEITISQAASAMGKIGGRSKSEKKTAAVRKNGKLGGRPKKV